MKFNKTDLQITGIAAAATLLLGSFCHQKINAMDEIFANEQFRQTRQMYDNANNFEYQLTRAVNNRQSWEQPHFGITIQEGYRQSKAMLEKAKEMMPVEEYKRLEDKIDTLDDYYMAGVLCTTIAGMVTVLGANRAIEDALSRRKYEKMYRTNESTTKN